MNRPVLIGMNNPLSSDPDRALWPDPSGCTGHRVWKMLYSKTGATKKDYVEAFDRRNLYSGKIWDPLAAAEESKGLWKSLRNREVLVLGLGTRFILGLSDEPDLIWNDYEGVRWCNIPHPSGLNRWYNDPLNTEAVAMRLEEVYESYNRQKEASDENYSRKKRQQSVQKRNKTSNN